MSVGSHRDQMRVSNTLELEIRVAVSNPTWAQVQNSDPLEEQWVLLTTEPFLQALTFLITKFTQLKSC